MAKHQHGGIRYKYYYAHLDKYPFELYYNIILYGKRYGLACNTWSKRLWQRDYPDREAVEIAMAEIASLDQWQDAEPPIGVYEIRRGKLNRLDK